MAPTRATVRAGNLPVELTSFVGRRQGLADIKRALSSTRLLTLTGTGGVGKTKLALRAGRESSPPVPRRRLVRRAGTRPGSRARRPGRVHGAWTAGPRIQLGGLDPQRLSRRQAAAPDPRQLRARARRRRPVLAGTLLRACPDVRILATSRQALGVTGEVVIDVPTLSLPEDGDASPEAAAPIGRGGPVRGARGCRAAGLRRGRRERRGDPERVHPRRRHPAGASSWRRSGSSRLASTPWIVDSLPGWGHWARETAACRSAQQTLEGAIDWSYQLLSEPERLLWARLSVFAGGFELDAAQAVCAGDGLDGRGHPRARRVARREVGREATWETPATGSGSSNRFASSAASGSGKPVSNKRCSRATETGSPISPPLQAPTTHARSSCGTGSVPSGPTCGAPSSSAFVTRLRRRWARRSAGTCGSTGPPKGPRPMSAVCLRR